MGLDVKIINLFIDLINEINSTIVFTSHDLSVDKKLCHRIAFINEGKIIKIVTQEEIKNLTGSEIKVEISLAGKKQELISELHSHNFITDVSDRRKSGILVRLKERTYYKDLLNILSNYEIMKIKEVETSLEDLFLKYVD